MAIQGYLSPNNNFKMTQIKKGNRKKKIGENTHLCQFTYTLLLIRGRFCSSLVPFMQFLDFHGSHDKNKN